MSSLNDKFFQDHPVSKFNRVYAAYKLNTDSELSDQIGEEINSRGDRDPEQTAAEPEIRALTEAADFFRWMRRPLDIDNKAILRGLLLEHRDVTAPMIREKILTNRTDEFIENAFDFFIHDEEDHSDWVAEHLGEVQSKYAKELLCLSMGFRKADRYTDFLKKQVEQMSGADGRVSHEQGPLIALCMITGRPL